MSRRQRREFTEEFKLQMVQLYNNGKPGSEIIREYDLTPSAFNNWVKKYNTTGSFKACDNRTEEENELIKLRKENQRLKMENDIFKASSADNGTKIKIILANKEKYSISAMCKFLGISRSLVYYKRKNKRKDIELENHIIRIFKESKNNYGSRKIKVELQKLGYQVSLRRIRKYMNLNGLVSNYTVKQFKVHKAKCNEDKIENKLNREFNREEKLDVVVSDLTYVNVKGKWNYICLIIDLFNREIIGYAAGKHKTADLVYKAFSKIKYNLNNINIFHTDRGNEFKNKIIEEILKTFKIERSLSKKGCPYDNAVAEATYKIIKTEFAFNRVFESFEELEAELFDYVHWYNNIRIHSSLNYLTPIEYKKVSL